MTMEMMMTEEEYEVAEWRVWNLLIPLCPAIKGIPLHLHCIVNCNALNCIVMHLHCIVMQCNSNYTALHVYSTSDPLSNIVFCALEWSILHCIALQSTCHTNNTNPYCSKTVFNALHPFAMQCLCIALQCIAAPSWFIPEHWWRHTCLHGAGGVHCNSGAALSKASQAANL